MRQVTETRRIAWLFLQFACAVVLLGTGLSSPASAAAANHDRADRFAVWRHRVGRGREL